MWQFWWFNSDSTQHLTFLDWLNSDSTQIPNLISWLNSDSTHLSQSWVKSDSRLITYYLMWPIFVDRGGGGERSNAVVGWFLPWNTTNKCKNITLSLQRNNDDDDWGFRARRLQRSFYAHNYILISNNIKTRKKNSWGRPRPLLQRNKWLNFDSTLTQMAISVIRLWRDSCHWFSRLNSFESESNQIWLTSHESCYCDLETYISLARKSMLKGLA